MSLCGASTTHYSKVQAPGHHSPIPDAEPGSIWDFLQHFTSTHCDGTDNGIRQEPNISLSITAGALSTARSYMIIHVCANALENAIRNGHRSGAEEVYAYAYIHGPNDEARIAVTAGSPYLDFQLLRCPASRIISGLEEAWDHILVAPLSRALFGQQFIMDIFGSPNCPCYQNMLIHSWGDICRAVRSRMSALTDTSSDTVNLSTTCTQSPWEQKNSCKQNRQIKLFWLSRIVSRLA